MVRQNSTPTGRLSAESHWRRPLLLTNSEGEVYVDPVALITPVVPSPRNQLLSNALRSLQARDAASIASDDFKDALKDVIISGGEPAYREGDGSSTVVSHQTSENSLLSGVQSRSSGRVRLRVRAKLNKFATIVADRIIARQRTADVASGKVMSELRVLRRRVKRLDKVGAGKREACLQRSRDDEYSLPCPDEQTSKAIQLR